MSEALRAYLSKLSVCIDCIAVLVMIGIIFTWGYMSHDEYFDPPKWLKVTLIIGFIVALLLFIFVPTGDFWKLV